MPFKFPILALLSVVVAACTAQGRPAAPPSITSVEQREGNVVITWTSAEEGAEHWLFYAPSDGTFSKDNWSDTPGAHVIMGATSPYTLSGLTNDTQYAFFLNARADGGPGGASTPTFTVTPRLAGGKWEAAKTAIDEGIPVLPNRPNLSAVAYGARFIAVGVKKDATNTKDANAAYNSLDGITWSPSTLTTDVTFVGSFNTIAYGGGTYIALGFDTNNTKVVSATSSDGLTWATDAATIPVITAPLRAMAYNGARFVAVGDGGNIIVRNGDPKWVAATTSQSVTSQLSGLTFANINYSVGETTYTGRFVAVGAGGTVVASNDGADATKWLSGTDISVPTTTPNLRAVAYGNAKFLAVGDNVVWSSSNGTIWSKVDPVLDGVTMSSLGNLTVITYGTQFIATDGAGKVYTSKDGDTWFTATPTSVSANAIARGDNHYVAVGNSGNSWTSYWTGP